MCLFSNGFFYSRLKNMSTMFFQTFFRGNDTLLTRGINENHVMSKLREISAYIYKEGSISWAVWRTFCLLQLFQLNCLEQPLGDNPSTNNIRGRSQTTLTRFWYFLTTYPPALTFSMVWMLTKSVHFKTTYLPRLENVVCERHLRSCYLKSGYWKSNLLTDYKPSQNSRLH